MCYEIVIFDSRPPSFSADPPSFREKLLHSGVKKNFHNAFPPKWILVDFGYVKIYKITL